jgi:hypothetical protein
MEELSASAQDLMALATKLTDLTKKMQSSSKFAPEEPTEEDFETDDNDRSDES